MIKQLLRQRLTPQRYEHSLGVAQTSVQLARIYGADPEVCETAGLLHDITKCNSYSEHLAMLEQYGVPTCAELCRAPGVLHAVTGAYFIEKELGITDSRIISAVRWHTSGRRGMSLYEKILYVADLIEPTRDYPDVTRLRHLARTDLDAVAFEGVSFCIIENIKRRRYIYPDTFDFYNEYMEKRSENGF